MRPSPAATPRLSHPQHTRSLTCGISELYSQIFLPVLASRAKMSSLPVGTYITPSMTIGSGSKRYLEPLPEPSRVIHETLRLVTFEALTAFTVEYRSLVTAPPHTIPTYPPR